MNEYADPFSVLGMHPAEKGVSVCVFVPGAKSVGVVRRGKESAAFALEQVHPDGVFEGVIADAPKLFKYDLVITAADNAVTRTADPYSFLPVMDEEQRFLFNQGNHQRMYDHLGSHVRTIEGVRGVVFAVWAPNAKSVSVVGTFNNWDGRCHPMRRLGASGIWELFIPGLDNGAIYKYEIKKHDRNHLSLKTDPLGYYQESPPHHATVVFDIDAYSWKDSSWLKARAERDFINQPMNIYEVHLGSWRKKGDNRDGDHFSYDELAEELVEYATRMGYTHIELMPIQDHPYVPSWGYQVGGFYAANHRFGTPQDFQRFVDRLHLAGIGVILDFVPGHFPKDAYGLAHFDGSHLYEHENPKEGEHKEWGTLVFNFGRHEVRNFMSSCALFWCDKFHIDGLRIDAVASMLYRDYNRKDGEWVANKYGGKENLEAIEFLQSMNYLIHTQFPGVVTIAEESTAFPMVTRPTDVGGLGFTFKWNMGWMHDILFYFARDPIYRKHHQNQITFGLWYAYSENFILVLSHDEVVHGKHSLLEKMPGDAWQKFANLRALYGFMFGHPGKKLLFMGGEFGMHWEWDSQASLTWNVLEKDSDAAMHVGIQKMMADLGAIYKNNAEFWTLDFDQKGFAWIDTSDHAGSTVSFIRQGTAADQFLVVVCNFTPVVRSNYRIGVPVAGFYKEIFNSDAKEYGGSGNGNMGGVLAEAVAQHNHANSIKLIIPPLGVLYFKFSINKS